MLLVLCEETDFSATWAAEGLRKRGLSLTTLTGRDLMNIQQWRHTLGVDGADVILNAHTQEINAKAISGVLNRLTYIPRAWTEHYGGPDREYAMQEMMAFYLSWIHALPGTVLNPPTPQGLCGNMRHPSAWAALGVRAGLSIVPFRQSDRDDPSVVWQAGYHPAAQTVFVVAQTLVGGEMLPAADQEACLKMATLAGSPLLGLDFILTNDGQWRLIAANVAPELSKGGDPLLDVLAKELLR